jgi:hypothetical protein
MPTFINWFNRKYTQWVRSQPGKKEDFLRFCELLGYPPARVLDWMEGSTIPQGSEVLCLAGLFGMEVYPLLSIPEPDIEILENFQAIDSLSGKHRAQLAQAIFESYTEIEHRGIAVNSEQAKKILAAVFQKWGF